MKTELSQLIDVDTTLCVNCHNCISACPVKFANDGSGDHVSIQADLCIACGQCIDVCTHHARVIRDDTTLAFADLAKGVPMVAIVAPAVAAAFPEPGYLQLNGFLASMGVSAIFDVSFGAELTIKSYLEAVSGSAKPIIAQPCPAIVNYIEIYQPELIPHLAPAHSPMAHTMVMIREYYPQYSKHKILVVSPCIAKKREFQATGLGDYNVTIMRLRSYLEEHKIDISAFPKKAYLNPPAERAVSFSSPGGLLQTALRDAAGIVGQVRQIEGPHTIYSYLKELPASIERGLAPLIVDCLNCEKGCNGGTATGLSHQSRDILDAAISARSKAHQNSQKQEKRNDRIDQAVKRFWKKGLYDRSYQDRSEDYLEKVKVPTDIQQQEIYRSLLKFQPADFKNCASCGYGNCQGMAVAIHNNLNRKENCHFFTGTRRQMDFYRRLESIQNVHRELQGASESVRAIESVIQELSRQVHETQELAAGMGQISATLSRINELIRSKAMEAREMEDVSNEGSRRLDHSSGMIESLASGVEAMLNVTGIIDAISNKTNVLAINAAIQAARYGVHGKAFAVIATEIRGLADQSTNNSRQIAETLRESTSIISNARESGKSTKVAFFEIQEQIKRIGLAFGEITDSMDEMSSVSMGILDSMQTLDRSAKKMNTDSIQIAATVSRLDLIFENLKLLSAETTEALDVAGVQHLRLGEMLVQDGLLSPDELYSCLQVQASRAEAMLGEILLEQGFITKSILNKYLSRQGLLASHSGTMSV